MQAEGQENDNNKYIFAVSEIFLDTNKIID